MRSAIVLVGGDARRAGGLEKYFFRYRGRTFIERLIETLSGIVGEVVLVARDPDQCRRFSHIGGISCVADIRRGAGPIGGVYTGIRYAKGDVIFVTACDMPCISGAVVEYLFSLINGYEAVVPCWDGGRLEPLHAVYRRDAVASYFEREEGHSLRGMVQALHTRYVHIGEIRRLDPGLSSFININRPEDLRLLENEGEHFELEK